MSECSRCVKESHEALLLGENKTVLRERAYCWISLDDWWWDGLWEWLHDMALRAQVAGKGLSQKHFPHSRLRGVWNALLPAMWEHNEMERWQGIIMIYEFNKRRKKVISASREKTADESMCAMRPRTTKLG
jgi:hypothetical protein